MTDFLQFNNLVGPQIVHTVSTYRNRHAGKAEILSCRSLLSAGSKRYPFYCAVSFRGTSFNAISFPGASLNVVRNLSGITNQNRLGHKPSFILNHEKFLRFVFYCFENKDEAKLLIDLIIDAFYEFGPFLRSPLNNMKCSIWNKEYTQLISLNSGDGILLEALAFTIADATGTRDNTIALFEEAEKELKLEVAKWENIGNLVVIRLLPRVQESMGTAGSVLKLFDFNNPSMVIELLLDRVCKQKIANDGRSVTPFLPFLGPVLINLDVQYHYWRPIVEYLTEENEEIRITRSFTDLVIGFPTSITKERAEELVMTITDFHRINFQDENWITEGESTSLFSYRIESDRSSIKLNEGKIYLS